MSLRYLFLATIFCVAFAQTGSAQHDAKLGKGGAHHQRFDDPEKWAKSFDDPERAAWQKPDEVIKALALKPDAKVADVGAGTGYFAIRLAHTVPRGTVYAVDLEPKMVAWLGERAKTLGLTNMKAQQSAVGSPNVPEAIDLVLMVNVFHHLADRPAYFKRIVSSLKPGGRVAIIDQNMEAPRGPPKHHRLTIPQIDAEMTSAGYQRVGRHDFLPYQNFVLYAPLAK